ncbi:MAG TPA: MarR family transcriptional regulator [Casimicrobiaceae bacterium]|jgi:DNA-binding MarR family transcriptional regulator
MSEATLDFESRASHADHEALRLWLRLFTCSLMVERSIRARLRERFGITLARFDYLAQLYRTPEGLRMQTLSQRLMVTGGNITGLTRLLVDEGLVERRALDGDRRVQVVRLTAKGRKTFDAMAAVHERWVVELFDGLKADERDRLHALLGRLKHVVGAHRAKKTGGAAA